MSMNREDIIRMARDAASADGTTPLDRNVVLYAAKSAVFLERFAALVAEAEREACAELCEEIGSKDNTFYREESSSGHCADAIRARGQV